MSDRTKVLLLGLGPEAIAYIVILVGLSIQWAVLPVLILGVGLPLVGARLGLNARRKRRRIGAADEVRSGTKRGPAFSWGRYLSRERHFSAVPLVFVTAVVFWVAGITVGTVLFAGGALIILADQYLLAPRLMAKVADWESGTPS